MKFGKIFNFSTTFATWILVWGHFLMQKISLFGQVFEPCCHLILNPSLDACNQCKI
jgi:hypothetical protein